MRILLALAAVLFLALPAQAAFQAPQAGQKGGFSGPGNQPVPQTVQQAKNLPDDTKVVLTGRLTNQLSKDDYTFQDQTGEIVVEIERKVFGDNSVSPANVIRIYGKVDKDFGQPIEIDVKQLEVLE